MRRQARVEEIAPYCDDRALRFIVEMEMQAYDQMAPEQRRIARGRFDPDYNE